MSWLMFWQIIGIIFFAGLTATAVINVWKGKK
jgi:hypothetical protein